MLAITDKDIEFAEGALLRNGMTFDAERREFICAMGILDVQAVPGSGKTTALLAKLAILERYMPMSNGTGVLVLAHTNAAVDEIREQLLSRSPRLFEFPNFVGTVQSFTDKFLTLPFYSQTYKRARVRIDNEIYSEALERKLKTRLVDQPNDVFLQVRSLNYASPGMLLGIRFGISDAGEVILLKKLNGDPLEVSKPRGNTRPENYRPYTIQEKAAIESYLLKLKVQLIQDGCLHFDDAYFLAQRYLQKYSKVTSLLRKRFGYVFVDEMQDLDAHQIELLDRIFNSPDVIAFQRIGDKNQAIFDGNQQSEDLWVVREECRVLDRSFRLNPKVARVVQPFGLVPTTIVGMRVNNDGSPIQPLPHLLLYDDASKERVIPKFASIIKELIDTNDLPPIDDDQSYCAIAWSTVWRDGEANGRLRLSDFFPEFSSSANRPTLDYSTLWEYLTCFDKTDRTTRSLYANLVSALLKTARIHGVRDAQNNLPLHTRNALTRSLAAFGNSELAVALDVKIMKWILEILKGNAREVHAEIVNFLPEFLGYFTERNDRVQLPDSMNNFVKEPTDDLVANVENDEISLHPNMYEQDGIVVNIKSVHSVKGQTHTATLYVESSYRGSYESETLGKQFSLEQADATALGVWGKQAAKMAYVGFSRPTHLLCVAVHRDRFEGIRATLPDNTWTIAEVL